jgi:peptidoglycan/LPS O-acetylase OafA/YrhL
MEISEIAPTKNSKIAFAHMLRGIAALSVVIGHFGYTFWMLPRVISGLIGAPAIEVRYSVLTAILDRFCRLVSWGISAWPFFP